MKLWVPLLTLLALFALAVAWQTRWRAGLLAEGQLRWEHEDPAGGERAASAPLGELPRSPAAASSDGWSHLLVGRPSGAAPLDAIEPTEALPLPDAPRAGPTGAVGPAVSEGEARHMVLAGESLSVICQQRYGSARPALVRALARFNGLADPDELRAGKLLRLPPPEVLLGP